MEAELLELVRPVWPPLRHVRRGWAALDASERAEVEARVEAVLADHQWGPGAARDSLRHFFTFLAQVETIAIEIPLRFLPHAPEHLRPTLRRQLVDEVFHSVLFARLAHDLSLPGGQPTEPLASAERLLERIRTEPDLGVSATLLNLVAEGWIETVFKHALRWNVANRVFQAVLEDEQRHVQEADLYTQAWDPRVATAALHALEEGLLEVSAEPTVGLAMLDLAGEEAYRAMSEELRCVHRRHVESVGLQPSPRWQELAETHFPAPQTRPHVVEDTPWRQLARRVWDAPRDPSMQGEFTVPVGHVPKRLLTPVLVCALGRAWARQPQLNRVVMRDRLWQLPRVNVGVRVLLDDGELATVVVSDADKRSVADVGRIIRDGFAQMQALRRNARREGLQAPPAAARDVADLVPPSEASFSVALSNPGKFGLVSGAGALSGAITPSTDISVGQRRRLPKWYGVAYLPAWQVSMGCLQDHRVFDGRDAGVAMQALREQLSRKGVRAILSAPDTLPAVDETPTFDDAWVASLPAEVRMLGAVGFGKYAPLIIGSATVGAAAAVGTYWLVQNLQDSGQQQQQTVVVDLRDQDAFGDEGELAAEKHKKEP